MKKSGLWTFGTDHNLILEKKKKNRCQFENIYERADIVKQSNGDILQSLFLTYL